MLYKNYIITVNFIYTFFQNPSICANFSNSVMNFIIDTKVITTVIC